VALGGSFTLEFSFEYTSSGEPAELSEFYFSVFDIDQSRNPWKSWQRGGTERIEVSGRVRVRVRVRGRGRVMGRVRGRR